MIEKNGLRKPSRYADGWKTADLRRAMFQTVVTSAVKENKTRAKALRPGRELVTSQAWRGVATFVDGHLLIRGLISS
jgi:hypothetical protein